MKFCPSCGTTWNPGDRFCSSCGYKIEDEETPVLQTEELKGDLPYNICPSCNTHSDKDNRFCENCGFDFQSIPQITAETEKTEVPVIAEPVAEIPANLCPGCGVPISGENRFCENCGYDLQPPAAPEPEPVVVKEAPVVPVFEEQIQVPSCPDCGKPIVEGVRFCENCGHDFQPPAAPEPVILEEAPVVPVVEEQIQVPSCPDCGKPIVEGVRFCENCGHDFNPVARPVVIPEPVPVAAPVITPQPVAPQPTPVYRQNEQSGPDVNQAFPKKKKGWLWILIGIVAFAGLVAGGWFGYEKLIKDKTPETPVVDTLDVINDVIADTTAIADNYADTSANLAEDEIVADKVKEPAKPVDNKTKKPDQKAKTDQKAAKKEVKPAEPEKKEADKNSGVKVVVDNTKPVVTNAKILLKYGDSDKAKSSGPKNPVSLTIKKKTIITRITTDHYNDGKGAAPGNIIIKDKLGNVVGTFHASGRNAADGTANAKWVAEPKITLEPGGYYISVSDMKSWSKTFFGYGFIIVEGSEQ